MNAKSTISIVIGTRPEAIKLIPIIDKLLLNKDIKTRIILTGQHETLVNEIFGLFGIKEDINLSIFKINQSLTYISCKILEGLKDEFRKYQPDLVIVQGDTTSAFIGALAAFYQKIKVAHVEAGLRTNDLLQPYPEEANRRLISQISNIHFAPTKVASDNLIKANVIGDICITGNTVIDALFMILKKQKKDFEINGLNWTDKEIILATIHRRENWGDNLKEIIKAIQKLIKKHNDIIFLIPLHPNKIVSNPIKKALGNNKQVFLLRPLQYDELASVIKRSKIVLTDSGGIQEEAPSLGKPVLILRNKTERTESISAGVAKLVGSDSNKIFHEVSNLITNNNEYIKMSRALNPYGDGNASKKIVNHILKFLSRTDS